MIIPRNYEDQSLQEVGGLLLYRLGRPESAGGWWSVTVQAGKTRVCRRLVAFGQETDPESTSARGLWESDIFFLQKLASFFGGAKDEEKTARPKDSVRRNDQDQIIRHDAVPPELFHPERIEGPNGPRTIVSHAGRHSTLPHRVNQNSPGVRLRPGFPQRQKLNMKVPPSVRKHGGKSPPFRGHPHSNRPFRIQPGGPTFIKPDSFRMPPSLVNSMNKLHQTTHVNVQPPQLLLSSQKPLIKPINPIFTAPPLNTFSRTVTSSFSANKNLGNNLPFYNHKDVDTNLPFPNHKVLGNNLPFYNHNDIGTNLPFPNHKLLGNNLPFPNHKGIGNNLPFPSHKDIGNNLPFPNHAPKLMPTSSFSLPQDSSALLSPPVTPQTTFDHHQNLLQPSSSVKEVTRVKQPQFLSGLSFNSIGIQSDDKPQQFIKDPLRPAPQPQKVEIDSVQDTSLGVDGFENPFEFDGSENKYKFEGSEKKFEYTGSDYFQPSPKEGNMLDDAFQPIFRASQKLDVNLPASFMKPIHVASARALTFTQPPPPPEVIDFIEEDGLPECQLVRVGLPECQLVRVGLPECQFVRVGLPECQFVRVGLPECQLELPSNPGKGCSRSGAHSSMGVANPNTGIGGAVHDGIIRGLGTDVNGAALTVALDVVQAWAVVLTLGFTIILFFFLAFCVCSKKDDSYDDYEEFEGVRTVRVYHHTHDGAENGLLTDQTSQASSRCTMKRELPAIPNSGSGTIASHHHQQQQQQVDPGQSAAPQQQQQQQQPQGGGSGGPCRPVGGVQVLPSTAAAPLVGSKSSGGARTPHSPPPSEVGPSTSSTVSSELATRHTSHSSFGSGPIKEHQYAHLQPTREEHPYAKVGGEPETDTEHYDDPQAVTAESRLRRILKPFPLDVRSEKLQKSHYESVLDHKPPAGPENGGPLYPPSLTSASATQKRSPSLEIQASSAIAGHTPANEELPYMTPKITQSTTSVMTRSHHSTASSSSVTPGVGGLSQLGDGFSAMSSVADRTTQPQQPVLPQQDRSPVGAEPQQQQHFSGDSQDSRGYTSISVREPLAALKAGQQQQQQQPSGLPPHMQQHQQEGTEPYVFTGTTNTFMYVFARYYMTVSDDSADETYACIYERSGGSTAQGAGSSQQTYAQIQPSVVSPSASQPSTSPPPSNLPLSSSTHTTTASIGGGSTGGAQSPSPLPDPGSLDPPAPPSVDSLKHVLHSRQASSGSTSGVGTVSSPPCEKKGASPLPPLPQGDQHYYEAAPPPPPPPPSATSPPHSGSGSPHKSPTGSAPHSPPRMVVERPTPRALEEMYAKVMKKRSSGSGPSHSRHSSSEDAAELMRQSLEIAFDSPGLAANGTSPSDQQSTGTWSIVGVAGSQTAQAAAIAAGVAAAVHTSSDPGYETVKDYHEINYPAYETVKNGRENESEPGYETVAAKRSSFIEPGYETVKGDDRISESEPGYETVCNRTTDQSSDPGYETVSSRQDDTQPEPGYEQVRSTRRPISECDSNYEQLKFSEQPDPGYESVKSCYESPYEQVSESPMYAEIKKPAKAQPVYASVKKKSPPAEDKPISSLEEELLAALANDGSAESKSITSMEEENIPEIKHKRSLEEEAAILVSTVEESALHILSGRDKSSDSIASAAADDIKMAESLGQDLKQEDAGLTVAGSDGSDTSSDAVFSRKIPYEQPTVLPGIVSFDKQLSGEAVENGTILTPDDVVMNDQTSYTEPMLLKKNSGSVETDNGTRDTNKASIEVQNGSAHSSVDNSSSGREDISPEDEVCMPPPEGAYEDDSQSAMIDDAAAAMDVGESAASTKAVTSAVSVEESSFTEEAPLTPTVLSIPVPQSFFPMKDYSSESVTAAPVSPPHASLVHDSDLPQSDQQLSGLPPPPPDDQSPLPPLSPDNPPLPPPSSDDQVPLPPPMSEDQDPLPPPSSEDQDPLPPPSLDGPESLPPPMDEDQDFGCVPPPPDLLSDAPECDLPPPLGVMDMPPSSCMDDLPPPMDLEIARVTVENGISGQETPNEGTSLPSPDAAEVEDMNVTVNPMAEIDELASRVAKACRDDTSPLISPSDLGCPPPPPLDDDEEKTKV
ncbi:hypothetical protein FHG87_015177 [Trinorchestia longiramus]|nr:hypothetical protein FHG87_015177 [Trinorchestia longiramus]